MFSIRAMTAYGRGCESQNQGRLSEALSYFEEATQYNPSWHAAWASRGQVLFILERFKESLSCFEKASDCDKNQYGVWQAQANIKTLIGLHQDALSAIDRALKLEPRSALVWQTNELILYRLGRFEDALDAVQKSLLKSLDAEHIDLSETWSLKGAILLELKKYHQALSASESALSYQSSSSDAWNNRGAVLNKLERYLDAIESFNNAIKINCNNEIYWLNRSYSLKKLKKYDKAVRSCEKALEINSTSRSALIELIGILYFQNKYDECLEVCKKLLCIGKNDIQAKTIYIDTLISSGQKSDASVEIEKLCDDIDKILSNDDRTEDKSLMLRLCAYAAYRCEKYIEAINILKRATSIDPENIDLIAMKIIILLKKSNPDDCFRLYEELLSRRKIDLNMCYVLGRSFFEVDRYVEASKVARDSLVFHKDNIYLYYVLSKAFYRSKRYSEAVLACEKALEVKPEDLDIWSTFVFAMVKCDRTFEALAKVKRILEKRPDDDFFWGLKGYILSELKDIDETISSCGRAISLDADNINAWYSLSRIYAVTGQTEMALQCLRETIDRSPSMQKFILDSEDRYFDSLRSHPEFKRLMSADT